MEIELHTAGELEKVGEDATEAGDFAAEGFEFPLVTIFFFGGKGRFGEGFAEELGVEPYGGEGVFDFMGEAAGHGSDFRHSFCFSGPSICVSGSPFRLSSGDDEYGDHDHDANSDTDDWAGEVTLSDCGNEERPEHGGLF